MDLRTSERPKTLRRPQTLGEEIANSVSHGIGLLGAFFAIPFLLLEAYNRHDTGIMIGAIVFSTTLVLLYLTSTLYHALPVGKAKHVFRVIEHVSIFFLIAGTYTPFTLGVLRGPWGWTLFGLIWSLAAVGVMLKIFGGMRFPILSVLLYLAMGWVVIVAIRPLQARMPATGLHLIALGGIAYTVGVIFYAAPRMRYGHFIWHLFVLAGTTFHFFAILWYGAPALP